MFTTEELRRYTKQMLLDDIGVEGQQKLKQAKVAVIGAGGLGCPVLQYLVATGIGTIGIVDGDMVELSNLHRQVLYHTNDIGKKKAAVAAEKLSLQNPYTLLIQHPVLLIRTM